MRAACWGENGSLITLFPPAEDLSWAEEVVCAALSRGPGRVRRLVASALQGVTVLHGLYQVGVWRVPECSCPCGRLVQGRAEHADSVVQ